MDTSNLGNLPFTCGIGEIHFSLYPAMLLDLWKSKESFKKYVNVKSLFQGNGVSFE
jgi:hypothetical protein